MLSMTSGFARAWLTWNVCAGDAQSVKALSMVKASSEAGGGGGDSSLVILCRKCEDHEFGASYRVRTCKYCRSTSWSKSRWLRDPLLPWYNGKRGKPLGQVCKLCPLVSRRSLLVPKAVALVYNTTDDVKTNINPNTDCRWLNVSGTSLQVIWWMMYAYHIFIDFSYT